MDRAQQENVRTYIIEHWDATTRTLEKPAGGSATISGSQRLWLPKPFTVPCVEDRFQELYYWDTYFAHLGLLRSGRVEQAQNNVDNFLYEVAEYGFVLNSNATYHLNRSQPPYLAMMIREIFDVTDDIAWVRERLDGLEAEYQFWMTERVAPNGLNRYYHRASEEEKIEFYDQTLRQRLGFEEVDEATKIDISEHYTAEAESGYDFTPRFGGRCANCNPVDLNALLATYENAFCFFAERTTWSNAHRWEDAWSLRRERIDRFLWDGSWYSDYNFAVGASTGVFSAACLHPLWAGLATNEQAAAMVSLLKQLDAPHGIATTTKQEAGPSFQWAYPNGWPPLQYAVVQALLRYGYDDRARQLAGKYLSLVADVYESTGSLWEKYDVVEGKPAGGEYEPAEMMGWTAGVFLALYDFYWA